MTAETPKTVKIKNGSFREEGHVYLNDSGFQIPSVTQALASCGLVDFSRVKRDVLERKRLIGSAVHLAAEFVDSPEKGELDWETVHEDALGYLIAYEHFCEDTDFKSALIEHAGIAQIHGMAFGYRIDRFGTIGTGDAKLSVILDLKCGSTEGVSWPLQLAAYSMIPDLPKPTGGPEHKRIALQLKKDGAYKIFNYEDKYDQRHWLSALSLTHYKMARKMAIPDVPDDIEEGLANGD